jgi:hypothetical protein
LIFGGKMAENTKESSDKITELASTILQNPNSSETAKSLAGSVLAQSNTQKQTSAEMEDLASKVLNSDKYNKDTKSLAGSVLSQSNKKR